MSVNPAFLVKRRLTLSELDPELVAALAQSPPVQSVKLHERTLKVRYDASRINIDQLLTKYPLQLVASRWQRWRLNGYRRVDQNVYDNSVHEPHCCNKMPRRR